MHVLQPTDDPHVFRTLDGRSVIESDGKLSTGTGFDFPRQVDILVEEDYYTGMKYTEDIIYILENENAIHLFLISRPFLGGREPPPPPPSLENIEQYVKAGFCFSLLFISQMRRFSEKSAAITIKGIGNEETCK